MSEKRVFNNVKWVVVCKTAQSLLQLIIGMLSARYLGPSNYGLINYAKSIVAFAVPFSQLGLSATLVKELIEKPEDEGRIMGTSLIMSLVSSLICIGSVWGFVSVFNHGEPQAIIVCVIYSLSLIFQVFELIQYWFHSKLLSKYPSVITLCAYAVVSAYRIFLLISQKNIYWFAIAFSIEYGLIGILLLWIYKHQDTQKFSFSLPLVKQLFLRSHHYIWAALMVTIFQNTDHIMLKKMSGNAENGFYTAAITTVSVCQYVYTAIIDSMRPMILSYKKTCHINYERNISRLYCIVIYLSLLQGITFTAFAGIIVRILYGAEYIAAVPVVRILVWYVSFSFMGAIRNVWILAEEKQHYLWKINLTGALLNIAINAALIPLWGAEGAALASLLTQFFTNFVLGFIIKPLRENNRLLVKGLNPILLQEVLQRKHTIRNK